MEKKLSFDNLKPRAFHCTDTDITADKCLRYRMNDFVALFKFGP